MSAPDANRSDFDLLKHYRWGVKSRLGTGRVNLTNFSEKKFVETNSLYLAEDSF